MKQAETTINLIEILADFMDALDPEKFYFRLWQWLQFVRARIKISLGIIRDETKPLGISAALVDLFSGQLANMFFYCAKTVSMLRGICRNTKHGFEAVTARRNKNRIRVGCFWIERR